MATLRKTATNSVAGKNDADIIIVKAGADADAGTISGGGGKDLLRFEGSAGDLLYLGDNISGIELIELAGSAPLDLDASGSVNGLTIRGNAGDNFIIGSAFADFLHVSAGADDVFGGDGNDTFIVNASILHDESILDGEDGFDTLLVGASLSLGAGVSVERVVITSTAANLSFDASNVFGDTGLEIVGSAGTSALTGTELDDTITGGGGRDILTGLGGDDIFLIAATRDSPETEVIDGGDGFDEIRFTSLTSAAGEVLMLNAETNVERVVIGTASGDTSGTNHLTVNASRLTSPLEIVGNNGRNVFFGTSGADTLRGGGGDDTFMIVKASDHAPGEVIEGGAGNDLIFYMPSTPGTLTLSADDDVEAAQVAPLAGASSLDASAASLGMKLFGNSSANALAGGAFNDTLSGFQGADALLGGDGEDIFEFFAPDEMAGDAIDGGSGFDRLRLSLMHGPFETYSLSDAVMGGIEIVELSTSSVAVSGFGMPISADARHLSQGLVMVGATNHRSFLDGSGHDDNLVGGGQSDSLNGRGGNDSLLGGGGDDRLSGDAGIDTMDGGDGSDTYFIQGIEDGEDVIHDSGASGADTVLLTFHDSGFPDAPVTPALDIEGIENIVVAVSVEEFPGTFEFDFSALDRSGLSFQGAIDIAGEATVAGSLITLTGTAHGDRFLLNSNHRLRYIGGEGNDTFDGANSHSRYEGGEGHDTVLVHTNFRLPASWNGIESVVIDLAGGSAGTGRVLHAGASANGLEIAGHEGRDRIFGTRHADTLTGNGGNDVLSGGPGNDVLYGGEGNDQLLGGAGDDVFRGFNPGDRVLGNAGEDALHLTGSGQNLDLTAIRNTAIRGVEIIDIRGEGANALKLAFGDVKDNLGTGPSHTLRIVADADDTVTLAGSWTLVDSDGITTTHSATSRGKTVFVEIEQTPSEGLTIFAEEGPDSIVGGTGNDTVVFEDGTFDFSDDFADGGDGTDTLVADGTLVNMFEGTFASFEKVEVRDGAFLWANNAPLEISATAGNNEVRLGDNAAQTYAGSDGVDTVHLGAAGQAVSTGTGDDLLHATPARLVGSNLDAGEGMDTLLLGGSGAVNLHDLGGTTIDIERIEFTSLAITSLTLTDYGFDVVLQKPTNIVSGSSEGEDDKFIFLSTNLFQDGTMTIEQFHTGFDDVIQLLFTDIGTYQGEVAADGVDAALAASAGLRDVVFDTDNGRLIVDYNQDDAYGGGDLTIYLPGIADLAAGADLILGA